MLEPSNDRNATDSSNAEDADVPFPISGPGTLQVDTGAALAKEEKKPKPSEKDRKLLSTPSFGQRAVQPPKDVDNDPDNNAKPVKYDNFFSPVNTAFYASQ